MLKISDLILDTEAKGGQMNQLNKINNNSKIEDKIIKQKNTEYSFNILEIIVSSLCPCCIFGNLKLKS